MVLTDLNGIKNTIDISIKDDGNPYYKQEFYRGALNCYNKARQIDHENLDILNNSYQSTVCILELISQQLRKELYGTRTYSRNQGSVP